MAKAKRKKGSVRTRGKHTQATKADIKEFIRKDPKNRIKNQVTIHDSNAIVDMVFQFIHNSLLAGKEVRVDHVGKLRMTRRAGRMGRNPKTGEPIQVPECFIPRFRASRELKRALKDEGVQVVLREIVPLPVQKVAKTKEAAAKDTKAASAKS